MSTLKFTEMPIRTGLKLSHDHFAIAVFTLQTTDLADSHGINNLDNLAQVLPITRGPQVTLVPCEYDLSSVVFSQSYIPNYITGSISPACRESCWNNAVDPFPQVAMLSSERWIKSTENKNTLTRDLKVQFGRKVNF